MRPHSPPDTSYAFGYRKPPKSGNVINGHGEKDKRRASHIFHNATGEELDWQELDDFFSYTNIWGVVKHMLANAWQLRRQDGPVAASRVEVDDPKAMAEAIKNKARVLGADLVGVTQVTDDAVYQGYEAPHGNAISIGLSMDRNEMAYVPHERAAIEVMRAYREVSPIAIELSEHIRKMGWPAKTYGNPNSTKILHIPLAINASLGSSASTGQ